MKKRVLITGGAGFIGSHLGYQPQISLEEGLVELADWLEGQIALDRITEAHAELVPGF